MMHLSIAGVVIGFKETAHPEITRAQAIQYYLYLHQSIKEVLAENLLNGESLNFSQQLPVLCESKKT